MNSMMGQVRRWEGGRNEMMNPGMGAAMSIMSAGSGMLCPGDGGMASSKVRRQGLRNRPGRAREGRQAGRRRIEAGQADRRTTVTTSSLLYDGRDYRPAQTDDSPLTRARLRGRST